MNIFVLFFSILLSPQDLKIEYEVKMIPPSSLRENTLMRPMANAIEKYGYTFLLEKHQNETYFYPSEHIEDTSFELGGKEVPFSMVSLDRLSCWSNLSKNQIIYRTADIWKETNVEDSFWDANWEIIEETMKIGDYNCTKAIGKNALGQDVVAWYCEDIPFDIGPSYYRGLPGAIIALQEKSKKFTAKLITTGEIKKTWHKPEPKKTIDWKSYLKQIEKEKQDRGLK